LHDPRAACDRESAADHSNVNRRIIYSHIL
jgi:hypothetical protein